MIQRGTNLIVADNTGAKSIRCFNILVGTGHRYAKIGDIIIASVKKVEPRKSIKKKEIVRAVIVRQRKEFKRRDGTYIRFDDNAAVILDGKTNTQRGGRIFGPIPRELKEKFPGIIAIAPEVV